MPRDTSFADGLYRGVDIVNPRHKHSALLPWLAATADGVLYDVRVTDGYCSPVSPVIQPKVSVPTFSAAPPTRTAPKPDDHASLSYREVKQLAKDKGLKQSGSKGTILKRIREHDASS